MSEHAAEQNDPAASETPARWRRLGRGGFAAILTVAALCLLYQGIQWIGLGLSCSEEGLTRVGCYHGGDPLTTAGRFTAPGYQLGHVLVVLALATTAALRDARSDSYSWVGYRRTVFRRESPLSKIERGRCGGCSCLGRGCSRAWGPAGFRRLLSRVSWVRGCIKGAGG